MSRIFELSFTLNAFLFISMSLLSSSIVLTSAECPNNCTCNFTRNVYNCSGIDVMPQFPHPNNVQVLAINSHRITEIKNTDFKGFYKLHQLDLSIGTLTKIAENAFDDMKDRIELIKLNQNHLESLPKNLFNDLNRLKTLEINANKLRRLNGSLFINMPKLNVIKFEWNAISEVEGEVFQNLTALETIYFFENKLKKIPYTALKGVPSIKNVYLGFNQITSVGDASLQFQWQNLTMIALDSNKISELTVFPKVAPNLEILDLGFNHFSSLSPSNWINLNSLKKLVLNGNYMRSLNTGVFSGLKNLNELLLRNMSELESIGPRVFTDMLQTLKYVDLSRNPKLNHIHEDAFQNTKISSLYLDNNNLTTLSYKILPLSILNHTSLDNNPWNCDCKLKWILDPNTVYNSSDIKSKIQSINCSTPVHLKGKLLNTLKSSELVCDPLLHPHDYKSRVETGIIVALVCFVVMSTFAIVMKCRKRIILRFRKYFMYRRFKAGDGVFTVENERDTEMEDVDLLL